MLALATCHYNDLYREAERFGIRLDGVEVEASADFDGIGVAASNIRYRTGVYSPAPEALISQLLQETDKVAEIHNIVRSGVRVTLQP
jgi:hypothetical protein